MADIKMPTAVVTWVRNKNWGDHHVQWHLTRIWDIVPQRTRNWAISQGWSKAPVQEGEKGNGLEFLAMHRAMVQILKTEFPAHASLFDGWVEPPTNPNDPDDPLPNGNQTLFDSDMGQAVYRLKNDLASFSSDDELGLFIETSLRPTSANPQNRSSDSASGIHNYLHGRWQDRNSPINLGDPTVNIENQRFWALHGWLESVWDNFRNLKGFSDSDPVYLAALEEGKRHMGHHMPVPVPPAPIPKSLDGSDEDGHGHHNHHHRLVIPPEIKEDILNSFYFCEKTKARLNIS